MSSRRHTIHLEVSSGEALAACRQTLLRLGWELIGTAEDRLTGDEEFWRLDCHTARHESRSSFARRLRGGLHVTSPSGRRASGH